MRAAYLPKEVVCAHAPAHAEGLIVPGGHTRAITYRLAKKKITTMKTWRISVLKMLNSNALAEGAVAVQTLGREHVAAAHHLRTKGATRRGNRWGRADRPETETRRASARQ